jgi:hypothetical protein
MYNFNPILATVKHQTLLLHSVIYHSPITNHDDVLASYASFVATVSLRKSISQSKHVREVPTSPLPNKRAISRKYICSNIKRTYFFIFRDIYP